MFTQVGYSVTEWSRGRVALCAACIVDMETRSAGFLVEPQNQGRRFISSLTSKPLGRFFLFGVKIGGDGFSGLTSKPAATVSWLSLKTKVVEGFLIWASKRTVTVW
jgi:hypothetical protein